MKLFTTNKIFKTELEIKKSKFISYLIPFDRYKENLENIKREHPKGRHFVYAYRILNEFEQIVENQSDDGEPKNSSGKPTLNVMQGSKLINLAIITVRYFGGIKLGIGGLVRAYGDSANLVINNSELIEYIKKSDFTFECEYTNLSKIEYLLNKFEIFDNKKEFLNDGVKLTLSVNEKDIDKIKEQIEELIK